MYILALVLLFASVAYMIDRNIVFLLLLSSALGLLAMLEMPIDWDRKIPLRKGFAFLSKERLQISMVGKFSGGISTITLLAYFVLKFADVKW
ncbi:hypothetical protein [Andreprevotia chitinilytica]|uniref:hypothetical protein n=1 Tax=Andreprevotia chitinilytica TaxID=396808 RepID=UPI001B80D93F|nr:hypothetical protein [Andreprevotia chitinilytica]